MRKTQNCLAVALVAALATGVAGCAGKATTERDPWDTADDEFDIFAFVEGRDAAAPAESPEVVAVADEPDAEDTAVLAVPDIALLDVEDFNEPAADDTDAGAVAAADETDDAAIQEPVATGPAPLEETDRTQSLVVGDDLVVHVVPVPATSSAPPGGRTVTLANTRSAPVPDSVFESIKDRLQRAGLTVVGSASGDYLVVCGRIPPRTMWGRSSPHGAAGEDSYVRASSLAEPLGVPMDRPGGGTWQAIVEIAFEGDAADRLRLRELHTIYSGDIRQVRRRDPVGLKRLKETLHGWAADYEGSGV